MFPIIWRSCRDIDVVGWSYIVQERSIKSYFSTDHRTSRISHYDSQEMVLQRNFRSGVDGYEDIVLKVTDFFGNGLSICFFFDLNLSGHGTEKLIKSNSAW